MPDVGVFIDAHHVADVSSHARRAVALIERIETAAVQLALGSGLAHRVVAADCTDETARAIAEDFGFCGGFRIRHCPVAHGIDIAAALSSEIFEAAQFGNLRTIVVVANPRAYMPVFDVLHRQGRLVVSMTTARQEPAVADLATHLELDLGHLQRVLIESIGRLEAMGARPTEAALYNVLRELDPNFAPRNYGYRNLAQAVERLDGAVRRTTDGTYSARGDLMAATSTAQPSGQRAATGLRSASRTDLTAQDAASACRSLASERADVQGFATALREALELLARDHRFKTVAETDGLSGLVVSAALRAAAPNYAKTPASKLSRLFSIAGLADSWTLVREVSNHPNLRFVLGHQVPDGFEPMPSSVAEAVPESTAGNDSDDAAEAIV
jgi:hypothetical protein